METTTEIALRRRISDVVDEYNEKVEKIPQTIADFEKAGSDLRLLSAVGGTYGYTNLDTGRVSEHDVKASLLKSAWQHLYKGLNIDRIASASDKRRFEKEREDPVEFTLDNIRASFGKYIQNPRDNILRGLAEVFCNLDPAYKSHDKVKIGVRGLPKRVIISNVSAYYGWGFDQLRDVLNALAQYQGKELPMRNEISDLIKDGESLIETRGVRLVTYNNGNGHLHFEPETLRDINLALAEYYGNVLADCPEEKPTQKKESTAVSKDLQYYPTPTAVVELVLERLYRLEGESVLEPSCGCGRFMDALRSKGAKVFGIEVNADRANFCRARGHSVLTANFLETVPSPEYDRVIMNPPFYGKHYAKHVKHALKFLKPNGVLTAILPVTARYDHGLLDGDWYDLPFGSFRESGTNINTTILTINNKHP